MCGHGPEGWHPNPAFFYDIGGGPMLDMGPYYMTGPRQPSRHPSSASPRLQRKGFAERIATSEALDGMRHPCQNYNASYRHAGV